MSLELFKEQNIDITNFEDNLNEFKETFAFLDTSAASDRFEDAICANRQIISKHYKIQSKSCSNSEFF